MSFLSSTPAQLPPQKVLVLRFSSIGDIVLTTPVLRSLKTTFPDCELHYFTKPGFANLLKYNPHVDRLHLLDNDLDRQLKELKKERFDFILDLHHNLRTLRIKAALGRPGAAFDKKNVRKYLMVRSKKLEPGLDHIVARYGKTLEPLGIELDSGGLELFIPKSVEDRARSVIEQALPEQSPQEMLALVLGANHATKRWLPEYFAETANHLGKPVLLLGGKDARSEADLIAGQLQVPGLDRVGEDGILMAAALMKQCGGVLTHDTGFMHIAAAFGMKVWSLWGNTVPEFGMTPYKTPHQILEVKGLDCRPCSKLGHDQCPQGHFNCMRQLTPEAVVTAIRAGMPQAKL